MLKKGDFKIRLHGKRLNGDFALIHMKSRRPGTKGTEWLLIKKQDAAVVPGYDIEQYDSSVLTDRSMAQIGGDERSAQWKSSRPASRGKVKAPWLADTLAKLDKKKKSKARNTGDTENTEESKSSTVRQGRNGNRSSSVTPVSSVVDLAGAIGQSHSFKTAKCGWSRAIRTI
jgi:hypothetical protein